MIRSAHQARCPATSAEMRRNRRVAHILRYAGLLTVACSFLAGGMPARAAAIAFDYGSLANGASDATIQSFMQSSLPAGASVTVTGAVASNSYNGDGYVTGPGNGSTSYTLASMDGTFIQNQSPSNDILMKFTGLTLTSVSFDFEVFPNGTCTNLSNNGANCGGSGDPNLPDLTLLANGSQVIRYNALVPGSGGNASPYTKSPASSPDLAPQLLGSSGTLMLPAGTTTLDFVDWPPTIAIDNLVINTPSVPEPGSLLLFSAGLAGLGICLAAMNRRRLGCSHG